MLTVWSYVTVFKSLLDMWWYGKTYDNDCLICNSFCTVRGRRNELEAEKIDSLFELSHLLLFSQKKCCPFASYSWEPSDPLTSISINLPVGFKLIEVRGLQFLVKDHNHSTMELLMLERIVALSKWDIVSLDRPQTVNHLVINCSIVIYDNLNKVK